MLAVFPNYQFSSNDQEFNGRNGSSVDWNVMSDYRHPPVRNLNSTIPVDVIRVKSYVNSPLILREWQ